MQPINGSSSIIGIEVRGDDVRVRFTNGSEYDYLGVGSEKITELVGADSVGSYFAKEIRPHFAGVRVVEDHDDGNEEENEEENDEERSAGRE